MFTFKILVIKAEVLRNANGEIVKNFGDLARLKNNNLGHPKNTQGVFDFVFQLCVLSEGHKDHCLLNGDGTS